jgi:hypothetical protein
VFQVDARTFGYLDRTRLDTRGFTVAVSAGADWALARRLTAGADVVYSPLRVARGIEAPARVEGLLTVRALIHYRIH